MNYMKTQINATTWVITEEGRDYLKPLRAVSFAIDTENIVLFDGKKIAPNKLLKKTHNLNTEQKRKRLSSVVWAWQCYDERNGFFMTNDFDEWVSYQCRAGLKFGWCYNSTFDFAQIDFEILAKGREKWKPHKHEKKGSGKGYNKGQPYTFESVHNDTGARYAFKLWYPYRNPKDRHTYTHAVEYRDFMKLVAGGLGKLLNDLNVCDNDGNPIRKLTMNYQDVDPDNLTNEEIAYCCNDVKGLYFAIKQFNDVIEEQSAGELHIFGAETNLMTAGGFAKSELLRSIYPEAKNKRARLRKFQRQHPLSERQDRYIREHHLYRGGISYVNPAYKGKLLTAKEMGSPMYRYDVNSEYPYSMASIRDLIGEPFVMNIEEFDALPNQEDFEAIYILNSVYGHVKDGYLGFWYDPFKRDFVDVINEQGIHLIFKRELDEMLEWYDDLEIDCKQVILIRRGDYIYRPYVEKNYKLKAQAKKDGNATLQQVAKLLLNSSYGKLAERIEREKGHYELNEETGAIHFVRDGVESDAGASMNVIIGALVTSFARCYILSKIREVCKGEVAKRFVYIDTDSIHAFAEYENADAYALGGLKLEATCQAVKYILPKTYIDIEQINKDGTINFDAIEVHSKGVNLSAIKQDLRKKQKGKKHNLPTLWLIDNKISYGAKYICLVAMNVKGGKILLPTYKYLARPELAPDYDSQLIINNMEGSILIER